MTHALNVFGKVTRTFPAFFFFPLAAAAAQSLGAETMSFWCHVLVASGITPRSRGVCFQRLSPGVASACLSVRLVVLTLRLTAPELFDFC